MLPEVRFERDLTASDREWLAEMDRAMQPQGVVRIEEYCTIVESNEFITRQNYRLRTQRKNLMRLMRVIGTQRDDWRHAALVLLAIGFVLVVILGAMNSNTGKPLSPSWSSPEARGSALTPLELWERAR